MSEAGEPAPLEQWIADEIPRLAALYDRFAHALDPFDAGRDVAEQTFNSELVGTFDMHQNSQTCFPGFSTACHYTLQKAFEGFGQAFVHVDTDLRSCA